MADPLGIGLLKKFGVDLTKTPEGEWYWPTVNKNISQNVTPTHKAIDIPGRVGDPIYASTSGTIQAVYNQPGGYGTNIRILTDQGKEIVLGHLSGINVTPGQRIDAGQVVGLLGNTGNSTGAHLHFEVRNPGADTFSPGYTSTRTALDPWAFFGGKKQTPYTTTPALSSFTFTPENSLIPKGSLFQEIKKGSTMREVNPLASKVSNFMWGAPVVQDKKNGATADDIRVGSLGLFGDVTIPKMGNIGTRIVIFVVFSIIGAVSLAALLAQNSTVRKVAGAAAQATPVGAGIKAATSK